MNEIEIYNEEWRDVVGYEGLYQVSNMGRVKSLNYRRTNQERILLSRINKDGYLIVILCKNSSRKTCTVHRLVALAFIENPNNYLCVNHKDENPSNNQVENLEWCTHQYNNTYGTCNQRRAEKLSRQVYQYDKDGTLIKIWESTRECGRNGFCQVAVSACCRNCFNREGNNIYKGFIWSYFPIN